MRKKSVSVVILILLLFVGFEILASSKYILASVSFSFRIWKDNIFPSLFPFFVLSELLVQYGFVEFIGELSKRWMNKLFRMNGNGAFVFVMGIISGFPSSAKYTKELYQNGMITEGEATKLLTFTHFGNPLFILGTVSLLFLNNKEAGILILICHYVTNIIIGLLFRSYAPSPKETTKVSFSRAITKMHEKRIHNPNSFGQIISDALMHTIDTLLLILGTITMFLVITTIIDQNLNLGSFHQGILNGFVEMTQGLKYISLLHIPLQLKSALCAMILSFGGLSVHMQMRSILSDTPIKYLPFFVARVIHALLSSVLVYLLFDWWLMWF